jgi:hypothetical protein
VNDEPFCLWETDIKNMNLEYIGHIDPQYFEFIADTNEGYLDGENKHRAASVIRTSYYHGLETLFSLICAALQAHYCIFGWMLKYKNQQLRDMVNAINSDSAIFISQLNIDRINWKSIAEAIFRGANMPEDESEKYIQAYSVLWSRFAEIFLDEKSVAEYNSIKHGRRIGTGGYSLTVGPADHSRVPPNPEDMKLIGTVGYAHSFLTVETVGGIKANPNIGVNRNTLAWNPRAHCVALRMISYSIQNILVLIKRANNYDVSKLQIIIPQEMEIFEKPFENLPNIPFMSWNLKMNISNDDLPSREQLKKHMTINLIS